MRRAFLPALAALVLTTSAAAQERVRPGQTYQEVVGMLGEPTGKMEMGGALVLMYPEGSVTLQDGVVTKAPKKKIRKREAGARGSAAPAWPPALAASGSSSLKEVAEVIPGYGHLETMMVSDAERRKIALSPESIRAESLRLWTGLLGADGQSPMGRYIVEAKAYRAKSAVKAEFDLLDQKERTGQAKCGTSGSWRYLGELPAGGGTGEECWRLGKEKQFVKQYAVEAYDYGFEYDKNVWIKSHWDPGNGRWDSISSEQQEEFKAQFSDTLEKEVSALKAVEAKPVDASKAASAGDMVQLYADQFRYRSYERFLSVLRDIPVPAP
ncbi:MAG: hypothetical protein FD126_1863 [Elusimicrobia bacterium]|nr:MAG: hypothetical protein FD126_1863 [Elusimicrobiota bacterium]